jgi:hypothetical protein
VPEPRRRRSGQRRACDPVPDSGAPPGAVGYDQMDRARSPIDADVLLVPFDIA